MNFLKELLKYETYLTIKYRSKDNVVIKPSSAVLIIIGILYILSGIDIIPEYYVHPTVFGYIDDAIILGIVIVFIYNDIGGILNAKVRHDPVQKIQNEIKPDIVCDIDESSNNDSPIPVTSNSMPSSDSSESNLGCVPVSPGINNFGIPFGSQVTGHRGDSLYGGNLHKSIYTDFLSSNNEGVSIERIGTEEDGDTANKLGAED